MLHGSCSTWDSCMAALFSAAARALSAAASVLACLLAWALRVSKCMRAFAYAFRSRSTSTCAARRSDARRLSWTVDDRADVLALGMLRCHQAQALRRRYTSGARGGASSWSSSCSRHAWVCQGTGGHFLFKACMSAPLLPQICCKAVHETKGS